MKKKFNILLILVISLLIGAAVTLCTGLGSVTHLSDRESYDSKDEVMSTLITGTGRASVVFSDNAPDDPGRYISRLRLDLYPKEEKPLDLTITVTTNDPEKGISRKILRDVNPVFVRTEILKLNMEHVTEVTLEEAGHIPFSLGAVSIDNSFRFSLYLFGFVTAAAAALLFVLQSLILSLRKDSRNELLPGTEGGTAKAGKGSTMFSRLFAAVVLTIGLALVFCLPRNKVGCDEETHVQAVLAIASFPSGELHVSDGLMKLVTVTEFNNPAAQPGGSEEQARFNEAMNDTVDYRLGDNEPEFRVYWNRVPAYLPMAVAMKAAKGLELPWDNVLLFARIANLLTYAVLIWLALRILPSGHALMTLLALMPQNLFLAATVSYDPFVTGCLYVGMAFCLKLLTEENRNRKTFLLQTGLMILFFTLGCLPKAVYAPLLLLALMIPFRRIRNKKIRTAFIAGIVLLTVAAFLAFILPTLVSPSETGDLRGGAVSESGQLEFIFSHPFTYAGILLGQMFHWIPQCIFGPDCTTFMGHLISGSTAFAGYYIPVLGMLSALVIAGIVLMATRRRKPVLQPAERGWTLLMCFAASALIWTAMYVVFTEPGAREIGGVQGRYFIPLMFPLYYALGAEMPSEPCVAEEEPAAAEGFAARLLFLVRKEQLWYHIMILIMVITLILQFLKAVVIPCCL